MAMKTMARTMPTSDAADRHSANCRLASASEKAPVSTAATANL
jgi:hypothetical protein